MADPVRQPQEPSSRAAGRTLTVDGLFNIRDLGGLRTSDGRCVRRGLVIRSENLIAITDDGVVALEREVDVRLVIDLRTEQECQGEGVREITPHRTRYRNLSLTPQAAINEEEAAAGLATNLLDAYRAQLRIHADELREAVELLAAPDNLPTLIHCTAGKDRTGIVVALLLDTLGVPADEIVADYAETASAMEHILGRTRESSYFQGNGVAAAPSWVFSAEPETMRSFLEMLHEDFGGATGWLLARGTSPATIEALRTNLLE